MLMLFRATGLVAIVLLLCVGGTSSGARAQDSAAAPAAACVAFKKDLSLGTRLAVTKAKLQGRSVLTIVALGSSSTTGFGVFGSGLAFPDVMKRQLLRLHPSVRVNVINSGRIMEDLADNIARIDSDVLRYKPDLVIWQIGTNDVVWRGIAANAKAMLRDSVRRMKAAGADVVLMDLQYAPLVLFTNRHDRMERIIGDVAAEEGVGHFPRFLLMKRAIDAGVGGLVAWDGLHNSATGHACVGIALAQMIDDASR